MELVLHWIWLVKLLAAGLTLGSLYKAFKAEWKSKFWNNLAIVFVLLSIITPVKLDTGTKARTDYINTQIEERKVLPPRVTDNSFKRSTSVVDGITAEDLK